MAVIAPAPAPTTSPASTTGAGVVLPGGQTIGPQQVNIGTKDAPNIVGPTPSSSLIVTSNASRNNFNNNVTSMNAATGNIPVPASGSTFYNPTTGQADGVNKFDPNTGKPLAPATGNTTAPAGGSGSNNSGTTVMNSSGVKSSTTNADGSQTVVHNDGTIALLPAPAKDGTDGSATGSDGNAATDASSKFLDPTVAAAFSANISSLTSQANDAKATVDAAAATLANDPAASAAAASITAQYEQLIRAQIARNNILAGSNLVNAARGGSLQYANGMETNFMSEEMITASNTVTELIQKENAAIIQSNTAFKNGDIKAFNDATAAYNKANSDKTTAILDLANATDKAVKDAQAATRQASLDAQNAIKDAQTEKHQNLQDAVSVAALQQKTTQDAISNGLRAREISDTEAKNAIDELNSTTNKPLTPSTISTLQKSNPLISIAYGDTAGDAQNAVKTANAVISAIASDYNDPKNVNSKTGDFTYDYVSHVLTNLPAGINRSAFLSSIQNKLSLKNAKDAAGYGITVEEYKTLKAAK